MMKSKINRMTSKLKLSKKARMMTKMMMRIAKLTRCSIGLLI